MEQDVMRDASDMEHDIARELETCREERDILKQKLHVRLDRRKLDKILFDDMTAKSAKELRLVLAANAVAMSRKDLLLRSREQELLLLGLKLDSALEDTELKDFQLSAVNSQLQEERKWLDFNNQKLLEMQEKMPLKVESHSRKLMRERDRRISQLEKLLDDKQKSNALELEAMQKRQTLEIEDLKELLESQEGKWNVQQGQWALERREFMAAAQERDDLRTEKEKRSLERRETQEALANRDWLMECHLQDVIKERDHLKVQRETWVETEKNLDVLAKERDNLRHKVEVLAREQNSLQRKIALNGAQREEEVKALVRERDFVWSQIKRVEENYKERVQKLQAQNTAKKQEVEGLRIELEREKSSINDKMMEIAVAKIERKQAEDLDNHRESELKATLQELQSRLEMYERRSQFAPAQQGRPFVEDRSTEAEPSERFVSNSHHRSDNDATADVRLEGPEVLNDDANPLDQDVPESQVEQSLGENHSKRLEELQRENGNLRRETENLKALYADLEDEQRRKRQKPARGGSKATSRDATIRNLKGELEAAATLGRPPRKDSTSVEKSGASTRSRTTGGASIPTSTRAKAGHNQPDRAELHSLSSPEPAQSSRRVTRSLAKTTGTTAAIKATGRNSNTDKCHFQTTGLLHALTSEDKENDPHDENYSSDAAFDLHDMGPGRKKLKVRNTRDASQFERLPLGAISLNQKSISTSPRRSSSQVKGSKSKSDGKIVLGSPKQTSKMMANLFSTAFSVPKLKNAF